LPQFAHGRDPARRIGSLPLSLFSAVVWIRRQAPRPSCRFLSAVHSCSLIVSMASSIGLRRVTMVPKTDHCESEHYEQSSHYYWA
jgi:hypothetical protein